jgi:pimeloyl-ACP methyl ester carboxylesterase
VIQPLFEHRLTLAGYDTRVLELEGVGHCPQVEASERFVEVLLQFSDERQAALA